MEKLIDLISGQVSAAFEKAVMRRSLGGSAYRRVRICVNISATAA